jgi:hypothetical protein
VIRHSLRHAGERVGNLRRCPAKFCPAAAGLAGIATHGRRPGQKEKKPQLKSIPDRIRMLGEVVERRDFFGVVDAVTVVLYRLPTWAISDEAGTHFVALFNPYGTQVMPNGTEAEVSATFDSLIGKIIAVKAEQTSLLQHPHPGIRRDGDHCPAPRWSHWLQTSTKASPRSLM